MRTPVDKVDHLLVGHSRTPCSSQLRLLLQSPVVNVMCIFGVAVFESVGGDSNGRVKRTCAQKRRADYMEFGQPHHVQTRHTSTYSVSAL